MLWIHQNVDTIESQYYSQYKYQHILLLLLVLPVFDLLYVLVDY